MNASEGPFVYIILGAAGSGRRRILADLLEDGLAPEDQALVILHPEEEDPALEKNFSRVAHWSWEGGQIATPEGGLGEATHVFFVTHGRENPIDQLEAFKLWLDQRGGQIGRVLCVVDCKLAEANPELIAWYEACIHFADVVLLAHRDGVANKWLSDFQSRFKDQYYPCLFEFVKEGRVKNPALMLLAEARRMSHLFDETEWVVLGDEAQGAEDDEGAEEGESEEEVEVVEKLDLYLERLLNGRRVKEIPEIGRFLPPRPSTG